MDRVFYIKRRLSAISRFLQSEGNVEWMSKEVSDDGPMRLRAALKTRKRREVALPVVTMRFSRRLTERPSPLQIGSGDVDVELLTVQISTKAQTTGRNPQTERCADESATFLRPIHPEVVCAQQSHPLE